MTNNCNGPAKGLTEILRIFVLKYDEIIYYQ